MIRSWKIGKAFGIGIYVHSSFLLLPAWVFLSNLRVGPVTAALYPVVLTLFVFGCIILHELGHALMARHFGIPTRDITLYPIGGVARLERMSERPWEEFWIALAGPAVNVTIALGLGGLLLLVGVKLSHELLHFGSVVGFLASLAIINGLLAAFNLLPAFPMDGGRVLRALLAARLGRLRATSIAAGLGVVFALLFLGLAVLLDAPGLMLLAIFLYFLGQKELALVRRGLSPLAPADAVIDVGPPAAPNFSGFTWDGKSGRWIEWRNGQPVPLD